MQHVKSAAAPLPAAADADLRVFGEGMHALFDTCQARILIDALGKIAFVNPRMAEMFGAAVAELTGSDYAAHVHPDDCLGDDARRRLLAGEVEQICTEHHYLRQDGSDFWGLLSGRRHEAASTGVSLVGVVVDITARKKAEETLRCSEVRFRSLIERAADAIVHGDAAGNITLANHSAAALSGYEPAEMVGMSIARLFSAEERARAPLRYDLLFSGATLRVERVLTRRDGSLVPIEMNSTMMADGTYQTFVRDISERKKIEDVLRSSEEKFAAAFQRAPFAMTISSVEDGRLFEVNDKFREVTGYSSDEVVGKTSVELGLLSMKDRSGIRRELDFLAQLPDRELVVTAKDGRQLACLWGAATFTVDGQRRLLTIAQDISATVRVQEELAKAQKLESLGLLAGGLAHDFNNVLTGVLGNLSFARMLLGERHGAAECLADCEKAALRASELTRQLLTFSRGGAPTRKVVETRRLIEEAVSFALRGSNVKAVIDLPAELWLLNADEGQIAQILANLLINAKQAMSAGGAVTIRAANQTVAARDVLTSGPYVRIEVADTGAGIAAELLSKVFDPYFTTKPGGTGLGLSSVYSIVKRHAGRVEVASVLGVGTTFTLYLPAAAQGSVHVPASDASAAPQPQSGQGKVLVMDDEALIRELASRVLEKLGYEAVTCADGEDAVRLFRAAHACGVPFRGVLLDLTVPGGMGGKEAAAQIRALDPAAILIVSTGYCNDPVVADCQAFGFSGAVAKPYAAEALAAELARLLIAQKI